MQIKKFSPYAKVRRSSFYHAAKNICKILQKAGYEAYFVGGCVRDLILYPNKLPKDIDIATSAFPENIQSLFSSSRFAGESFGINIVQFAGFCFELATFRIDSEYADKRRPKFISKGNFFEDSCRRDFTINALYYDPCKKIIKDPHGGMNDIKNKIIRCVGNAEIRFDEDALRILRAFRFAANFCFQIDEVTKIALLKYVNNIRFIAKERVILEFIKVKKFYLFTRLIDGFLGLNLFFKNTDCFKNKMEYVRIPQLKKYQRHEILKYPFLYFLMHLSFLYKIENPFILYDDINLWPLNKKDNIICKYYLKLLNFEIFIEKNLIGEDEAQFLFFLQLLKIIKISEILISIILINIKFFITAPKICYLIKIIKHKVIIFNNIQISYRISDLLKRNKIPNYYTQIFIDYFRFKYFLGMYYENLELFVLDNFNFIKKVYSLNEKI